MNEVSQLHMSTMRQYFFSDGSRKYRIARKHDHDPRLLPRVEPELRHVGLDIRDVEEETSVG